MEIRYVIIETDIDDETFVIGVCSSPEKCRELVKEYYGEDVLIEEKDVRDSGIEFTALITEPDAESVTVTVQYFETDKL
jgi:NADPH-dependent curcumin reductase CurA